MQKIKINILNGSNGRCSSTKILESCSILSLYVDFWSPGVNHIHIIK